MPYSAWTRTNIIEPTDFPGKSALAVSMQEILWNDNLSVHVKEIDDQHKELIKMINRLGEAVKDGSWPKKIVTLSDVLLEMIDYLDYHFSTEEKYMIAYNYPEYQAHREEHQRFVREVTTFAEAFHNGKTGLSNDILLFLKDWYLNHIMNTDAKCGAFLSARGLA